MINKIQSLRKLNSVGMPTPTSTFVPYVQSNRTTQTPTPFAIPTAPPNNLVFNSIADVTAMSNQPLVHNRDAAGNIILINDTNTKNQVLTIESISYKVPSAKLNLVADTQFNYFKFPPRLSNIEVVDEINLTDAVDDIDLVSTRYAPSEASGRQPGYGRKPILRAGQIILGSPDDDVVDTYQTGYYDNGPVTGDWQIDTLLNMETVLAGVGQLKPSKFIITPDLIDAGENIYFNILIKLSMYGSNTTANTISTNQLKIILNKVDGSTGGYDILMYGGTSPVKPDKKLENLTTQLTLELQSVRDSLDDYKSKLKEYDNMLASIGDRTTTQQRLVLNNLKSAATTAKYSYDTVVRRAIQTQKDRFGILQPYYQGLLKNTTKNYVKELPGIYEYRMRYLIDISKAKPYDEYWISTSCGTRVNAIDKAATYWQIVPISKIKNAL